MKEAIEEIRMVDVQAFIDDHRFSLFQWIILALCFMILLADGFDTAAAGFIAPSLVQEWGISRASLGPVMSAALVGLGIGALVAGPIADRIGRKVVLVLSVFFFGAGSFAAAHATSIEMLTVLRFLTGLGLGASMPNAVTLMSEYAPARIRGMVVNTMFCGFSVGLAMGGVASAWLIPRFGWQSVLLVGGIGPFLLTIPLILLLPESVQFMVLRKRAPARVARILRRIEPDSPFEDCHFTSGQPHKDDIGKSALALVLSPHYRLGTVMLWLSYFMALLIFYLLTGWMPTLFKASGLTLRASALITSLFPVGGCLGILCVGWMMDRFNAFRVIALAYIVTGVLVVLIGRCVGHQVWLCVLIFLTGVALSGAASSMSPLAAIFYPTSGRATGVAWMLGVGRSGAVASAFIGAYLTGMGWQFGAIFSLLAVPSVIAALALGVMARGGRNDEPSRKVRPAVVTR